MNVEFSATSSVQGPGRPVVHGNDVWCAAISNRNQKLKVNLGNTQMSNITFFKLIVKQEHQQSFNQYDAIIKRGSKSSLIFQRHNFVTPRVHESSLVWFNELISTFKIRGTSNLSQLVSLN